MASQSSSAIMRFAEMMPRPLQRRAVTVWRSLFARLAALDEEYRYRAKGSLDLDIRKLLARLDELPQRLEAAGLKDLAAEARKVGTEQRYSPFNFEHVCGLAERLKMAGQEAEYRGLAEAIDFLTFLPAHHQHMRDLSAFERETYIDIAHRCAQSPASIASTIRFVEYIEKNELAGDIVECGVWRGASPYAIAKTLLRLGQTERRIFMYDTYDGMPYAEPVDVPYLPDDDLEDVFEADRQYREQGRKGDYFGSDNMRSALETTRANVELSGYPKDKLHFVKGMVEDTIPETIPEQIAILRLDTDLYRSTKHELEHLFPRLCSGGVLIIDDYGFFLGSKQATDEYFEEQGLRCCLFRVDEHVRAYVKP